MLTFEQFLTDAAVRGEAVNILFEERLFDLAGVLHRIGDTLAGADIPYEVVGGLAVLIHVEEVRPEHSALTRDVDLRVRRADLDRINEVAAKSGFRFLRPNVALYPDTSSPAVRFAVSPGALAPEPKRILGKEVLVIPIPDLVRMKLTSFRLKDQVHVQTLDAVGLITPQVEANLPAELAARLQQVRDSE